MRLGGASRHRMRIGWPLGMLALLFLSFCCSSVSYADEVQTIEDLEVLSDCIPDDYARVMSTRTQPSQFVSIEGDKAVLKTIETKSVSYDIASLMFEELVVNAQNSNMATYEIMHDLAWRYYNHPEKSDKLPLQKARNYDVVYGSQVYGLQECTSYGDWCAKNNFFNDFFASLIVSSFSLRELNNQQKTWDSTSPGANEIYSDWYYYYEGQPSSGGGGAGENGLQPISAVTFYYQGRGTDTYGSSFNAALNNNSVTLLESGTYVFRNWQTHDETVKYIDDDFWMFTINVNNGDKWFWHSQDDFEPVYEDGALKSLKNVSGRPAVIYNTGIILDPSTHVLTINNQNNWSHVVYENGEYILTNVGYATVCYPDGSSGGGGGSSNDPVPSPDPLPRPEPSAPIVENINAPTYTTNNYTTINQTDVDLQPIIDALATHDENMFVTMVDFENLFNDWMDVLKRTLENWRDAHLGFMDTLFKDLVYYLDQVNFVLFQILEQLQMKPYVPVPDVDTININYNNAVDRLSTKFPFSIPWDVKLIMELLEQPRQAPQFDFPVLLTEYTVHIDLSPLDPMAAILRFFSSLFFTSGLLMVTRKMVGF